MPKQVYEKSKSGIYHIMKILEILDLFLLFIYIFLSFFNSLKTLLLFLIFNYIYLIVSYIVYYKENTKYFAFRSLCWIFVNICFLNTVNFLNLGNIFKFSITISLLIFLMLCFTFKNNLKSTIVFLVVIATMNIFYLSNTMITASKVFTYAPIMSGVGEIIELNIPSRNFFGIDGVFSMEINIDNENLKQITIMINEEDYYKCNIGDEINYIIYDGLWGEEYITIET